MRILPHDNIDCCMVLLGRLLYNFLSFSNCQQDNLCRNYRHLSPLLDCIQSLFANRSCRRIRLGISLLLMLRLSSPGGRLEVVIFDRCGQSNLGVLLDLAFGISGLLFASLAASTTLR
jgi:hypothetical protein